MAVKGLDVHVIHVEHGLQVIQVSQAAPPSAGLGCAADGLTSCAVSPSATAAVAGKPARSLSMAQPWMYSVASGVALPPNVEAGLSGGDALPWLG